MYFVTNFYFHTSCKWNDIFTHSSLTLNEDFLSTCRSIFFDFDNSTLNFSDNRFPFRVTCFKDFLDTWKTLCDIGV